MPERVEVHEPYRRPGQQHEADMLGMYVFLATEIMLFGGVFAAIFVIRGLHPEAFVAASKKMHLWIGAGNTLVLLTSSLCVALAVAASRAGRVRWTAGLLSAAAGLGILFLGFKGLEYWLEYRDGLLPALSWPTRFSGPVEELFMNLYLIATGLHAFHLTVGICLLLFLAWRIRRGSLPLPNRAVTVETSGLYWHLVDIVWVFLYPALYLAR
ncbi:cytochrome c oxidase subunit 3 [Chelativorans sp. AA-79]|uniref:cytochrome c oxidase subunit 3 n=1 Tax=Chelativorans sp. AA-79 TaxID=3028735 RepID=UPI0023F89B47|nr:cytochrome c oxidase subunit 3 [Chelativorans sp. AA-79]WEX10572.1 cytochrome c oxidase subunit 3 [Chelativorans sp. AA-79]